MTLLLNHPEVAYRSCDDCEEWVYDKDGKRAEYPPRSGKPVRQIKGKTPCYGCAKCRGSREKSPAAGRRAELDDRNWRTLALYSEQLVSPHEVDGIQRKNFGIIRRMLADYDRDQRRVLIAIGKANIGVKK